MTNRIQHLPGTPAYQAAKLREAADAIESDPHHVGVILITLDDEALVGQGQHGVECVSCFAPGRGVTGHVVLGVLDVVMSWWRRGEP